MGKKKKFFPKVHLDDESLNIFTDGSCGGGGVGDGGVGVVFLTLSQDKTDWDAEIIPTAGYLNARIGQMELQACIISLQEVLRRPDLAGYHKIAIYCDSQYVRDEFKRMLIRKRDKWLNTNGAPIENALLWKELLRLTEKLKPVRVSINHVKGHNKDPYNEMADKAAKQSRESHLQPSLEPSRITRKRTAQYTSPHSIEMCGQLLEIRILEPRWLKMHKLTKYRIEVISGPDVGANTFICAGPEIEVLKRNRICTVRVNNQTENPRIVDVIS